MAKFAAKDSNKNITLSPHGTGKVVVGTGAADATVQSDGNHNLVLQTGNATTGSISITDGANGDIAISPNGTGTVVVNTDLDVDNININGNAITSTNTDGNIAITPNGTGEVDISKVDIDGGAIDAITLGTNSAVTEAQIDNININGNAIISSNTDGNIDITPNGTGQVNISKVGINSGTIDGATIATSNIYASSGKTLDVSAGTFTTSAAQKQAIVDGATNFDVSGGTFTTSSAQKQAIVQAGPGSGTLDVSSGTLTTSSAQKQAIIDGASANQAGVKTALNASGSAPIYACRAWVNFNGTGTVAIRGSGNVSSITDNGTADFTVNFSTAMPDTNYGVSGFGADGSGSGTYTIICGFRNETSYSSVATTSSVRIVTIGHDGSNRDPLMAGVNIFR
jgi:uncharacterized protein (AIM24 family)